MEELDRIFEDTGPLASTDQEERDTGETSRGIGSIDIIRLFGRDKLEHIQESLSKATGLAFVTVDYKGEPVTDMTFSLIFAENSGRIRNCARIAGLRMPWGPFRPQSQRKPIFISAHAV